MNDISNPRSGWDKWPRPDLQWETDVEGDGGTARLHFPEYVVLSLDWQQHSCWGWVIIINQLCCYIEEDGFVCEWQLWNNHQWSWEPRICQWHIPSTPTTSIAIRPSLISSLFVPRIWIFNFPSTAPPPMKLELSDGASQWFVILIITYSGAIMNMFMETLWFIITG